MSFVDFLNSKVSLDEAKNKYNMDFDEFRTFRFNKDDAELRQVALALYIYCKSKHIAQEIYKIGDEFILVMAANKRLSVVTSDGTYDTGSISHSEYIEEILNIGSLYDERNVFTKEDKTNGPSKKFTIKFY